MSSNIDACRTDTDLLNGVRNTFAWVLGQDRLEDGLLNSIETTFVHFKAIRTTYKPSRRDAGFYSVQALKHCHSDYRKIRRVSMRK
jgi:hypothetical protein